MAFRSSVRGPKKLIRGDPFPNLRGGVPVKNTWPSSLRDDKDNEIEVQPNERKHWGILQMTRMKAYQGGTSVIHREQKVICSRTGAVARAL